MTLREYYERLKGIEPIDHDAWKVTFRIKGKLRSIVTTDKQLVERIIYAEMYGNRERRGAYNLYEAFDILYAKFKQDEQ